MKSFMKKNLVLLAVILAAILAAVIILVGRIAVEYNNKTYDIVMDYASLEAMADQSSRDVDEWLQFFRSNGIEKVAVMETSALKLSQESNSGVYVKDAQEITRQFHWEEEYPLEVVNLVKDSVHDRDTLIICTDYDRYKWILNRYRARAGEMQYKTVRDEEQGVGYIWIYGNKNGISGMTWSKLSLGILPETSRPIKNAGLQIIPRTGTIDKINGAGFASAVLEDYANYESPYFINGGEALLGYDDKAKSLKQLRSWLKKSGAAITLIENSDQSKNLDMKGLDDLLKATDDQAVRAFSMWDYIQCRYNYYGYKGPQEITNSLYRAAYERNCHVIYLKMILKKDNYEEYVTKEKAYTQLLDGFRERMDSRGYTFGTVAPMKNYFPFFLLRFLVGAGGIAAAILLLKLFVRIREKPTYVLLGIGLAGLAAAMFVIPNFSRVLMSICGGVALPSLAAAGLHRYIVETNDRYPDLTRQEMLIQSLKTALVLAGVSFCGALLASAAISDTSYMLEINLYRGVKAMQLVPMAVFVISFLQLFIWEKRVFVNADVLRSEGASAKIMMRERKSVVDRLLDRELRVRGVVYAIGVLLLLAVLWRIGTYYLARTGNAGTGSISTLEIRMRNIMETIFVARPRTKEFLLGYPCMMLTFWAFRRRVPVLPFVFGAGAVIGYTSIVNTFLHIRTPFVLSLYRVLLGLVFGLIIGTLLVLLADLILGLIRKEIRIHYRDDRSGKKTKKRADLQRKRTDLQRKDAEEKAKERERAKAKEKISARTENTKNTEDTSADEKQSPQKKQKRGGFLSGRLPKKKGSRAGKKAGTRKKRSPGKSPAAAGKTGKKGSGKPSGAVRPSGTKKTAAAKKPENGTKKGQTAQTGASRHPKTGKPEKAATPETGKPADVVKAVGAGAPAGTAKPENPSTLETGKPADVAKAAGTGAPAGTAKPENPATPETGKPADVAKAAETGAPTGTAKPENPATPETGKPADVAKAAEAGVPTGTAKPVAVDDAPADSRKDPMASEARATSRESGMTDRTEATKNAESHSAAEDTEKNV